MFHSHFYPVIVNFGKKMGLMDADAEDIAQETMIVFLKAYRKGNYDREKGRLSNWLFGVARKVILNRRKKIPQEKQIPDQSAGTPFWNLLQDEQGAAVQCTWDDEWRKMVLKKCLARVQKECGAKVYQAFEMYAVSDIPADEVSRRLNISKNAVYIAKNRILTRLRELEREFDDFYEGSFS